MMRFDVFNPDALERPRGFNHGLAGTGPGRVLFVAGQPAIGPDGRVVNAGFGEQFGLCLDRILTIVREAGGSPEHVGRMTVYVTNMDAYRAARGELASIWEERFGRHYPAMALVAVSELVDEGAVVEIEATAILP